MCSDRLPGYNELTVDVRRTSHSQRTQNRAQTYQETEKQRREEAVAAAVFFGMNFCEKKLRFYSQPKLGFSWKTLD